MSKIITGTYPRPKEWDNTKLDYSTIHIQVGNFLQGKVLTIIDASFSDPRQLKAVKDLVKQAFSEQLSWVSQLCNPNVQIMSRGQAEALIPNIEEIEANPATPEELGN